jgi:hypothetical protein
MSVGGERIRLQISNGFGGSDLPITAATLALPTGGRAGVGGIDVATLAEVTFDGGKKSVTVPRGQVIYTDPINYKVEPESMLTVSLYFETGQPGNIITGHPGSRTTSWMCNGNYVKGKDVDGGSTLHW